MTIRQLPKPCFTLDPSPWDEDDYGTPHYKTWAEASEALTELREERGPSPEDLAELEPVKVKREDSPCWIAECDADGCEETYEDDEGGGSHFGSAAELETWMAPDGWTYRGGDVDEFWPAPGTWTRLHADEVFCSGHRPADAQVPPPSPAELEAAGQLRLPGVA
jgi:hypothetical protein